MSLSKQAIIANVSNGIFCLIACEISVGFHWRFMLKVRGYSAKVRPVNGLVLHLVLFRKVTWAKACTHFVYSSLFFLWRPIVLGPWNFLNHLHSIMSWHFTYLLAFLLGLYVMIFWLPCNYLFFFLFCFYRRLFIYWCH